MPPASPSASSPAPAETSIDLVLPDEPVAAPVRKLDVKPPASNAPPSFDADSTVHFQARMSRAPEWFCSFVASNTREKRRFRDELVLMKGAWPLLMKQRNGGKWTPEDKDHLKSMVRSASSVSPYLFIWAIPGSMILLPFLAWYLDRKRRKALVKARVNKSPF